MDSQPEPSTATQRSALQQALARGRAALRANLIPGIILNLAAASIGAAYAWHDATRAVFGEIGELKGQAPWLFAATTTMLFGGLLPVLMQRLGAAKREPWRYLLFLLPFWALKGLEVNLLYVIQAWLFGHEATTAVVAIKVLVDQGVYVVLWAMPTQVLAYRWMDHRFRAAPVLADLRQGKWFLRRCFPLMITNWCIWTPAAVVLYMMPTELQLPFQNLILCLWVLLLSFMTKPEDPIAQHPEQVAG